MLEYAIQFIALAVPSSAARLALDIRFFGRNGIEGGGAVSIGVIASVRGFITQVLLILVISSVGAGVPGPGGAAAMTTSSMQSGSSSSGGRPLLVLTAVLVVLGLVAVVAVLGSTGRRCGSPSSRYRAMLASQPRRPRRRCGSCARPTRWG